jgi:hypothetical protein
LQDHITGKNICFLISEVHRSDLEYKPGVCPILAVEFHPIFCSLNY